MEASPVTDAGPAGAERVVVVESDPSWADTAVALMAELQSALPDLWEQFEHIGSTSVPGLAAKPVIDLMASTPNLGAVVQV